MHKHKSSFFNINSGYSLMKFPMKGSKRFPPIYLFFPHFTRDCLSHKHLENHIMFAHNEFISDIFYRASCLEIVLLQMNPKKKLFLHIFGTGVHASKTFFRVVYLTILLLLSIINFSSSSKICMYYV